MLLWLVVKLRRSLNLPDNIADVILVCLKEVNCDRVKTEPDNPTV
ncbi:MAG: hypothetical protein RMZ43_023195 [Nostoc sp. CmiVER01]|nr:hypothetical protein [Nostoc sp. CmiVER01]MDZ8123010.1 hypothetical protein [Nostoc sp. CmiVER01]